jgi:hypothetical protein
MIAHTMTDVAFYTVANAPYFLGLAGLVNSLRLTGHTQPIVVLDAGLTPAQRAALADQCEFVEPPAGAVNSPATWKAAAAKARAAEVVVFIDSDIVVTGSLEPILDAARQGRVCAYPDPDPGRWFAEWDVTFGLPPMRRQTYVNTGLVAISTRAWPQFVERWWGLCEKIRTHPTVYDGARGPTSQMDQDAFNALMMSEFPSEALLALRAEEGPITQASIRDEVEVLDERSFSCVRRGIPVRLIHWASRPKPWFPDAPPSRSRHAYTRLLVRAATWPDAPVRLSANEFPWWMRQDPVSRVRVLVRRVLDQGYRGIRRRMGLRSAPLKSGHPAPQS